MTESAARAGAFPRIRQWIAIATLGGAMLVAPSPAGAGGPIPPPVIGAAKQMSATGAGPYTVTIDYTFECFPTETAYALSATDDLTALFGQTPFDWSFVSIVKLGGPANFDVNPAFTGVPANTELILPGSSLEVGEVGSIRVTITTVNPGIYSNQITVYGENSVAAPATDLSTDGTDPDPDGNGNPGEAQISKVSILAPYDPLGVGLSVPIGRVLAGRWSSCFSSLYAVPTGDHLTEIQSRCDGEKVMLACGPVGSTTLSLLAEADRAEVFTDPGNGLTDTHLANGSDWYFSPGPGDTGSYSWGFAAAGDGVERDNCDVAFGTSPEARLCWHLDPAGGGYRCGETTGLNESTGWIKYVYQYSDRIFADDFENAATDGPLWCDGGWAEAELLPQGSMTGPRPIAAHGSDWIAFDNTTPNHQIIVTNADEVVDLKLEVWYPDHPAPGCRPASGTHDEVGTGMALQEIQDAFGGVDPLPNGRVYVRVTNLAGSPGMYSFFDNE